MSLNLYKIPGVFVVGFSGRFGTGKTLSMVEQGLKFADKLQLNLVANFYLNMDAVRIYCNHKKLKWFANNGTFTQVSSIQSLLSHNDSLLLLDEGGVELFARDYRKTDKDLFDRLFRIRHFGSFLFYSCQLPSQIDKQFRDMTHLWLHCNGFQKFDLKLRRSKLYSRSVFAYSPAAYLEYIDNPNIEYSKVRRFALSQFRFSISPFALYKFLNNIISSFFCIKYLLKKSLIFAFNKKQFFVFPFWVLHYFSHSYPLLYSKFVIPVDEDLLFACFDSFSARNATQTNQKAANFTLENLQPYK